MKNHLSSVFGLALLAGVSLVSSASAVITIDYVTIGNAGNAPDPMTNYGAVAYNYQIARNETTVGEYCEFLNAAAKSDPYALYNPKMGSDVAIAGISRSGSSGNYVYAPVAGTERKPITYVSWFDAARFCNWVQNGQGSGSTETGAYTLNGAMSGIYTVNAGATTWIPSENEWYKAAFYDATKFGTGGYWLYPTRSGMPSGNTIGVPGASNYWDGDYVGYPGMALTDVGAYGANSASFYGTNDQGGNVWEWNDLIVSGSFRGERGGSWGNTKAHSSWDSSLIYNHNLPSWEDPALGFRIAAVPEPGCAVLTLLASGVWMTRRKR